MRILWVGDIGPTGFGTVTWEIGSRLVALGEDIRFISQNDLDSVIPDMFITRTLSMPSLISHYNPMTGVDSGAEASDAIADLINGTCEVPLVSGEPWGDWKPEAVVLLGDFAVARAMVSLSPAWAEVPTLHYVPIEGRDLTPLLATDLWSVTKPVAMSNFGADEIGKIMGHRPPMIYHGVDTGVFHPIKPSTPVTLLALAGKEAKITTRAECKQMWSAYFNTKIPARLGPDNQPISDKWMLRTDRHMPRKLYNTMLRALVPVLAANPDAIVILHCASSDQGGNLTDSVAKMPQAQRISGADDLSQPESWSLFGRNFAQVLLTNIRGMAREALVTLYNAADVYLSTSAEGFGLTVAEALACGTPAVGIDYSAVPEVIGPAGVVVPIAFEFDNVYDHMWAAIHEPSFGEAVHKLLNDPERRLALGRKGPRHVRAMFRWDTAARDFQSLLSAEVAAWQASPPLPPSLNISATPPVRVSSELAQSAATSS